MILGKKSIKDLGLISKVTDEGKYGDASYDLTVGTIVTPDGDTGKTSFPLKPQGIVKVVSQEEFKLPPDVMGYVHVKTALCNEGVLALNIGIVDPCFSGPLQSALLNFGKVTHRIHKGDVFGRITFHQSQKLETDPLDPERVVKLQKLIVSETKAKASAQSDVDKYLAADFLDFANTVKKAAKRATSEYRNTLLWYAPVLALLLAIFTYLLNFANMHRLEGYINIKDRATETTEIDELKANIKKLTDDQEEVLREIRGPKESPRENATSEVQHGQTPAPNR